ncbi:MAG: histidine kinase dimerization/phospho-acceptor domain-containing protein [Archangium sp.]|nr:histidine kinase dimerization/phospho-acceptor domain-containing protein [Archangium sp.]
MIDRFVPPEVLAGPADAALRARLAVAFAWVSAGFFLIAGASQARADNDGAALLDAFLAMVTMASPVVVRRTGRVALVTHVVLALVSFAVITLAVLVRGAGMSGATVMLAVIPLFATLVVGVRSGAVWLVLSLLAGIGLGVLGQQGLIVDQLTSPVRLLNDHFVLVLFTGVLFAVATVFELRKDDALRQISNLEEERRRAELSEAHAQAASQLAQAEQLASLGRIAGAAAHEINNPLAYIIGNLNFVAKTVTDPEARAALQEALEGAHRIQALASGMSAIARPGQDPIGSVVVADVLAVAINLAEPHTASRARVVTKVAPVPPVSANEARLTQVLLSLLLNAAQAQPEGDAAQHEISVEVSGNETQVVVEIVDTGKAGSARGFGEGGSLAVILGEAVVRSFGGSLALESVTGRTMARLTLVPAPVA